MSEKYNIYLTGILLKFADPMKKLKHKNNLE